MNSQKIKELHIEMRVLAGRLRREMGWQPVDSVKVTSIIRAKKILTVYKPLEDVDFSGMAIRTSAKHEDSSNLFMLINTSQAIGKQRFTACHEFYHLLFQRDFSYSSNSAGKFDLSNEEEYKADVFAANLLLPMSGIEDMVPIEQMRLNSITLETVLKLEQHFGCSRAALLRRLKSMHFIDSSKYEEFSIDVITGALENGYDASLYRPDKRNMVVGDYATKARTLFENGRISGTRYRELMAELGLENTNVQNQQ